MGVPLNAVQPPINIGLHVAPPYVAKSLSATGAAGLDRPVGTTSSK